MNLTIQNIPESIGGLVKLKTLELYGAYSEIPDSIGKLQSLENLDIVSHKLLKISFSCFAKKLYDIDLSHNKLKTIPQLYMEQDSEIKFINLSSNNISNVPEYIIKGNPENLKQIRLQNNNITSFPYQLTNLNICYTENPSGPDIGNKANIFLKENPVAQTIESQSNSENDRQAHMKREYALETISLAGNNIPEAEDHFKNITQSENPELYAQAQYSLGYAYENIQNIDKAFTYYTKIERKDDPKLYVLARASLGYLFESINNNAMALEYYLQVKESDGLEIYFATQYQAGLIYEKMGEMKKAI